MKEDWLKSYLIRWPLWPLRALERLSPALIEPANKPILGARRARLGATSAGRTSGAQWRLRRWKLIVVPRQPSVALAIAES